MAAGTGFGVDRYSYELIHRAVKRGIEAIVVEQKALSLRSFYDRFVSELAYLTRLVPIKAELYHAVSQITAKTALFTRKSPLVTTVHDLVPFSNSITSFYYKERSLRYEYSKFCIRLVRESDRIIVPFKVTKKDVISTLGLQSEKVVVVPLGVNHAFFRPLSESISCNKKIVLFVGGLTRARGADTAIRVFSLVQDELADAELWLVGRIKEETLMRGLVQRLGISDKVRFLGFRPEGEMPRYYNLADVFLLPSRVGFCLQILEAMACGTPVIVSDTPDVRETVGRSGLLIKPIDIEKLSEAVIKVLVDNRHRKKLGEEALRRSKYFSWEKTVSETLRVYDEILRSLT